MVEYTHTCADMDQRSQACEMHERQSALFHCMLIIISLWMISKHKWVQAHGYQHLYLLFTLYSHIKYIHYCWWNIYYCHCFMVKSLNWWNTGRILLWKSKGNYFVFAAKVNADWDTLQESNGTMKNYFHPLTMWEHRPLFRSVSDKGTFQWGSAAVLSSTCC